jgi:pimeloyl-ACP methyl ester carboxylesterase
MSPGLLYVTMQPRPGLSAAQFHDWYNNEHGPLRLRLPFIPNGFRYRATDSEQFDESKPEWLAFYDVTDSAEFTRPPYTTLREDHVKTQREKDTMAQIAVDRHMYDFIQEWRGDEYQPLDRIDAAAAGHVLIAVSFYLQDPSQEAELDRWYKEEHVNLLSKVPGWRRSRRFVTSSVTNPNPAEKEYLALHEYAPQNGLGGLEFQAATTTPWTHEIYSKVVKERKRRAYEWFYTFGPAPRDLQSLASPDYSATFTSRDGLTKTFAASQTPNKWPVLESYVTTADGLTIPYQLEGASDPEAPLIVLSNSILTDWGIWDDFLKAFFAVSQNKTYRVLRYLTRGRANDGGKLPVTIDLLAQDVITLLDALRVPKAAALIGVSLGGATVLNTALKHPSRIDSFISSDTNAVAPASNAKAWNERLALAEGDSDYSVDASGARLIGEKLAEATVRRWFIPESYDGGKQQAIVEKVKEYVRTNRLDGFKQSVKALYGYDVRDEMKSGQVRGIFAVGSGDGVLPNTMKEMAANYASGVPLHVIEGAGHLPMAEQPEQFAKVVTEFLRS